MVNKEKPDSWDITTKKLNDWKKSPSQSGWQLRKIFSSSQYFNLIARRSLEKSSLSKEDVTWQEFWGFYLEKLPEEVGINLLLHIWKNDVLDYIKLVSKMRSKALLTHIKYNRMLPKCTQKEENADH